VKLQLVGKPLRRDTIYQPTANINECFHFSVLEGFFLFLVRGKKKDFAGGVLVEKKIWTFFHPFQRIVEKNRYPLPCSKGQRWIFELQKKNEKL